MQLTPGGTIKCSLCVKTFQSKSGLAHHMRHHTGKYLYYCDSCRKGFINRKRFIEHQMKHSGRLQNIQISGVSFVIQRANETSDDSNYRVFSRAVP